MCRLWDLGIGRAAAKFLEDPELHSAIKAKAHRTTENPATFYGSQQYKDLDKDCAGALTAADVNTLMISVGGDGVQLLNWGSRVATVLAVKCEDLPAHLVQTGRAVAPLIIIEGPAEPSNLNHILRRTVDFLVMHAPSGGGESMPLLLFSESTCVYACVVCSNTHDLALALVCLIRMT